MARIRNKQVLYLHLNVSVVYRSFIKQHIIIITRGIVIHLYLLLAMPFHETSSNLHTNKPRRPVDSLPARRHPVPLHPPPPTLFACLDPIALCMRTYNTMVISYFARGRLSKRATQGNRSFFHHANITFAFADNSLIRIRLTFKTVQWILTGTVFFTLKFRFWIAAGRLNIKNRHCDDFKSIKEIFCAIFRFINKLVAPSSAPQAPTIQFHSTTSNVQSQCWHDVFKSSLWISPQDWTKL